TLGEMSLVLRQEKPVHAVEEGPSPKAALRPAVARLKDVHVVYVGTLGGSDGADVIRDKIINRLVKSGRVRVVIRPQEADAALIGGAEVFDSFSFKNGRGRTRHESRAAVQLVNTDGEVLWAAEGKTGIFFWSGDPDGKIAKSLLNAIRKDEEKPDK